MKSMLRWNAARKKKKKRRKKKRKHNVLSVLIERL